MRGARANAVCPPPPIKQMADSPRLPCGAPFEQQRECEWRCCVCECEQRLVECEHELRFSPCSQLTDKSVFTLSVDTFAYKEYNYNIFAYYIGYEYPP